ncbi:putative alcohol dehydrogenase [Xylogone sp. PMI_703]|nr:putative alcohol dehydrogenase [Xylogone sp. PMI_703]
MSPSIELPLDGSLTDSLKSTLTTNGRYHKDTSSGTNGITSNSLSAQTTATPTPEFNLPNPSLQVTADHRIKLVPSTPVSVLQPDQVLIHVRATGICGSDIHFWKTGCIGSLRVEGDCILGHEAAGQILQVGSAVTDLKPGDRIAIEPGVPCMSCFLCTSGRYNLCESVVFAGVYPHAGSAQRYKVHPAKWVHKIPDDISYEQGALLEPLSVVMHGISSCQRSLLGRAVSIHGAGPIGLVALAAARASGAHPIVITDVNEERLEFAKKFVPSCKTYLIRKDLDDEGNAAGIRELFEVGSKGGDGIWTNEYNAPDTVLECTGVESSIITATYTCRRGGTVMVIGVGKAIVNNLPFMHISLAEINLKFINRYRDTWPAGIMALSGGILNLDSLVTHRFPLERATEAMELVADLKRESIKVMIVDDEIPVSF